MTKQVLTPKSWLNKSINTNSAKYSAYGFLVASREFLTTGELAPITSPILARLDTERAKALAELRDTEALTRASLVEIQNAIIAHIVLVSALKQEQALDGAPKQDAKPWIASVVDEHGIVQTRIKPNGEEEELIKSFALAQEADRWLTRRLFEQAAGTIGLVDHATLNVHTCMSRDEAVAAIIAKKKQPVCWQRSQTTKVLGFQHRAAEKRVSFSKG
jgi:hypothetical protein